MESLDKRLDKLEAKANPKPEPTILVVIKWEDGTLTVDGERITQAEYEKRYPDDGRQVIHVGVKHDA